MANVDYNWEPPSQTQINGVQAFLALGKEEQFPGFTKRHLLPSSMKPSKFFIFSVACAFLLACFTLPEAKASVQAPPESMVIPPMVDEESVSTRVPSEAAPGQGLAVNMIYPQKARYAEGAPVVVVVPGANRPDGLSSTMHAAQQGFIELRFAFPGGGEAGFTSGGIYDNRGASSLKALRDVILFAQGKIADNHGHKIADVLPVKPLCEDVGIVGWDNGGNTALVTMAKYSDSLKDIGWIAFYESPVGELFFPAVLGGGNDSILNRHYRQGSGATGEPLVDWRKLWWQGAGYKEPGEHKKVGEPEIIGVIFFDENHNGFWDESFEYALSYVCDIGLEKQIYAPEVIRAIVRRHMPAAVWQTVCSPRVAEAYFQERDGSLYLKDICDKYPNLLICVYGGLVDHWQRQPDHPHIASLYNSFLANKAHWVRLNPDPRYVSQISAMGAGNFSDNFPNAPIDASQITDFLEPKGLVPDYVFMEAACAELADRKHDGNLKGVLTAPLVKYQNGASAGQK